VLPDYDPDIEMAIREDFEQYYTISFANYPVNLDHYLPQRQLIDCVKL
jgi:formylmethanofuran dehydrogenase subunit A